MRATFEIRDVTCFFCEAEWAGISQALRLSEREVDILQCLMLGENECEAAAFLRMSRRTVRTHLDRIRWKLGMRARTQVIVRLFDAHIDWLSTANPPPGCRLNGRLAQIPNPAIIGCE